MIDIYDRQVKLRFRWKQKKKKNQDLRYNPIFEPRKPSMENLPLYITLVFSVTTLLTAFLFYYASNNSSVVLLVLFLWLALQALISRSGFYIVTDALPPRFLLLILPPFTLIAILFATSKGRLFIDSLNQNYLTLIHIVRVPVELVLFWLFVEKTVPELMTFEGRNFDILSGITAPFIYYFGYVKKQLSQTLLLIWNFICLGLLINIVFNAIFSAPFPFQKFAFDQPNIAVLYFPYVWLPCCIVPLVFLSHLASIRQLMRTT